MHHTAFVARSGDGGGISPLEVLQRIRTGKLHWLCDVQIQIGEWLKRGAVDFLICRRFICRIAYHGTQCSVKQASYSSRRVAFSRIHA